MDKIGLSLGRIKIVTMAMLSEMRLYFSVRSDFPGSWPFNGCVSTFRIKDETRCPFGLFSGVVAEYRLKSPVIGTHTA